MATLAVPTIHLNGTSREELLKGYAEAYSAVLEAITKVQKTCPNGRDFYTQGPDAIKTALEEHKRRLRDLHAIARELEEIGVAIA